MMVNNNLGHNLLGKFDVCGSIYVTNNYDLFNKLEGNRDISNANVRAIIKSIKEKGDLKIPILVNDNLEILDGQHRIEARKTMGLPVYFIIVQYSSVDNCITLNNKRKSWTEKDYVNAYALCGEEAYIILQQMYDKYGYNAQGKGCKKDKSQNKLPYTTIRLLSTLKVGHSSKIVRDGQFEIDSIEAYDNRCREFLKLYETLNAIPGSKGKSTAWVDAYKYLITYHPDINIDSLINKMATHYTLIGCGINTETVLTMLQNVYNAGLSRNKRVSFADDFKRNK